LTAKKKTHTHTREVLNCITNDCIDILM